MTAATGVAALLLATVAFAQPREGFIPVTGGPVWYQILGQGSGTPILAVHGGPGGSSCWFTDLTPLAKGRKLVLFDQLGGGRSGRPMDASLWTVDRFVEELHTVRQKLGLKRIHLMGHSWGGSLVAEYVLRKGSAGVVSLVLASPLLNTKDWIADADELRRQLPEDVQETLRRHEAAGTTASAEYRQAEEEYSRRFLRRGAGPPPPACTGSAFNPVIYEQMWGPSEFHATGSLLTFDVTPKLASIRVPVLLIVGEFDEARPVTAARYQTLIPGSKLKVVPGAAHALWGDNPADTISALAGFFEDVEKSAVKR